ncbi:ATP-binding protein [Parapusillimonas sp. JC17]|uniref:ATP-binding protein n=1 Tax=Parapusillimonas sp. JC17 TaxID=3445768 RepID=UPI003F9F1FD0
MRLIPRSISAQLLVVWILAILVAHGVAVFLLSWWRADNSAIHPISARMIETRIVAAYRLASSAHDGVSVLESVSLPDSTFRITSNRVAGQAMSRQEQAITRALREMIDLPPGTPVRVKLERMKADPNAKDARNWLERVLGRRQPLAWEVHVDVGLPDGRTLSSDHWPILIPAHWSRVLSLSLLVGMIPTALIAVFFGRRIMRPLKNLSAAANKVSRGEHVMLPLAGGPDEVREITQAFNEMQENLVRFVQARTMMVAAIGHDLRTPMTSLRIRAELVDEAELRQAMIHTLDEMRVMVEEILRFAKDDALQEPTLEVAVNGFVQEVVDEQCMSGRKVVFQPHMSDSFSYRCRPIHLKRALNNLIDNAARYGPVTVVTRQDGERLLAIEVLDIGPGIAADQLAHVFEPFVRLDASRSHSNGGSGLGLTIAQSCVRAHGGSIKLESRATGGLCAIIELPI